MKSLRELIQIVLEKHHDKDAETLSGMVAGVLYAVNLTEPGGGWFDDDPRYVDEDGCVDGDKIWDDYKSIGIEGRDRF